MSIRPIQSTTNPSLSFPVKVVHSITHIAHTILNAAAAAYNYVRPINPVTLHREFRLIPTGLEKFIGKAIYPSLIARSGGEVFSTDSVNGNYVRLVQEVGQELAKLSPRKELEFKFAVLRSEKDNAWCLPGGNIGINLGLIQQMERDTTQYLPNYTPTLKEKIAAVLSHEITHAAARHSGRKLEFRLFLAAAIYSVKYALVRLLIGKDYDERIKNAKNNPAEKERLTRLRDEAKKNINDCFSFFTRPVLAGMTLCGSRKHELEADKYGMYLLNDSAYSPRSAVWLMHFFEKHHSHNTGISWVDSIKTLFSTHPSPQERLQANKVTLGELL